MIYQTLPGLALRQAECAPLASLSQNHRSGDGLGIHIDQRLPPISDLLRDVPPPPPPPALSRPSVVSPRITLPVPVASSPSPTGFPTAYSTWSTLPPRPRSVPGQYAGFLPPSPPSLVPRRASADCPSATSRSYSVPGRTIAAHHQPTSPDRERDRRQRRTTKQHTRRRRGDSSSPSFSRNPTPSSTDSDSPDTPPYATLKPIRAGDKPAPQRKHHQQQHHHHHYQHLPHPQQQQQHQQHQQQQQLQQKGKRNNTPYTFEQEAFFIYHRIDLDLSWEQVRRAYMARWPSIERTVSGLECSYYRTNGHLPETTADGLLVLVAPEAAAAAAAAAASAAAGDGQLTPPATPDLVERSGRRANDASGGDRAAWWQGEGEEGGARAAAGRGSEDDDDDEAKKKKKDPGYMWYRGAAYRTKSIKCRKARISLLERFPEELVDEANDWVREEHRVLARDLAERRRRQREEFLAARVVQSQGGMLYY